MWFSSETRHTPLAVIRMRCSACGVEANMQLFRENMKKLWIEEVIK